MVRGGYPGPNYAALLYAGAGSGYAITTRSIRKNASTAYIVAATARASFCFVHTSRARRITWTAVNAAASLTYNLCASMAPAVGA